MGETTSSSGKIYRFAGLTLDSGRRLLHRGAREIALPRRSFDLLEALVVAAPGGLSTDELMDRVWRGAIVNQATIAKRVELLRQVLDDDSQSPRYIALVRGYGYRLIPEVAEAERPGEVRNRRSFIAAALLGLGVAAVIGWIAMEPRVSPPGRSIAVIPFVALSSDSGDQVFADGLTEEIAHALASSGRLMVAGRASASVFRDNDASPQTIGDALGVAHVLSGSVRHTGDRLRITAQLTGTADGFTRWSQSYDREMTDIINIQQDIARSVAARLNVSLVQGESGELKHLEAISPEAYALYLRAVSLSPYGKLDDLGEAQALIEQVTRLAPDFAPGWNRFAAIHGRRLFGGDPDYPYTAEEIMPRLFAAIAKALTIDPNSAEAYANLGGAAWVFEGDAEKAAPLITRALELDPWNLDLIAFAGEFAKYIGHIDKALQLEQLVIRRDPLCNECRFRLAKSYMYTGRYPEAERELLTLRSIHGGYWWNHGVVKLMLQQPAAARHMFDRDGVIDYLRLQGRAMALCDLGRVAESRSVLDELVDKWGEQQPVVLAQAFAHCRRHDDAFAWLYRSLPAKTVPLQMNYLEPLFNSLRDDSRWAGLMHRIGRSDEQTDAIPFSLEPALARLAN